MPYTFDLDASKRIVQVVRTVEGAPGSHGNGPGVSDFTSDDSVLCYNNGASDIPAHGLVWMNGWDAANRARLARQAQYAGVSIFGIACAPIPVATFGWAWVYGEHDVLVNPYASHTTPGKRLGVWARHTMRAPIGSVR